MRRTEALQGVRMMRLLDILGRMRSEDCFSTAGRNAKAHIRAGREGLAAE